MYNPKPGALNPNLFRASLSFNTGKSRRPDPSQELPGGLPESTFRGKIGHFLPDPGQELPGGLPESTFRCKIGCFLPGLGQLVFLVLLLFEVPTWGWEFRILNPKRQLVGWLPALQAAGGKTNPKNIPCFLFSFPPFY